MSEVSNHFGGGGSRNVAHVSSWLGRYSSRQPGLFKAFIGVGLRMCDRCRVVAIREREPFVGDTEDGVGGVAGLGCWRNVAGFLLLIHSLGYSIVDSIVSHERG